MADILTPAEAAAILRVSSKSVVKLCTSGQLAHFKVGKLYRIRRDALERYMAGPVDSDRREFGSNTDGNRASAGAIPSTPYRQFPGLRGGRQRDVRGRNGAA